VREALECLGGAGFVEESILPRLYREAPLNAIWEGAGNIIALDVLRALQRSPEAGEAFIAELTLAAGGDVVFDRELAALKRKVANPVDEADARRLVERLALCWGASLCLRHEPEIADAYIRSRLDGDWGSEFGTLSSNVNLGCISRRACPV
jgi:putative acyl-CoA dehydrogenase